MTTRLVIIYCLLFPLLGQAQNEMETATSVERTLFSIGETLRFQSSTLEEERMINVYLPQYYAEDSLRNYPIIYLLDGSADEDFIHIAGLVQFGSFSWINFVPESIIVGISNVDRKRDFTYPTRNKQDKADFPTTGGSEPFIDFLTQELPELINKQYRVNDTTTIIGQSLGGLLATEVLFKQPDAFDNYVIVSPSLWWDDESLLEMEAQMPTDSLSVFIAVGKEGKVMERVANELHDKLKAVARYNARLGFEYYPEQDHGDVLHLAAYTALQWLFKN